MKPHAFGRRTDAIWGKLADIENPGNPNNPGIIYNTPISYRHKLGSHTKTKGRRETTSFRSDARGRSWESRESQPSKGNANTTAQNATRGDLTEGGKNQMSANSEMGQN